MTQINLLPWREVARQQKKLQFIAIVAGFAVLTFFFMFLIHLYLSGLISRENNRISFMQSNISTKQREYTKLREDKKKQIALEAELIFINSLKFKSYNAVRILNELAERIPSSIILDKIIREDNKIKLQGKAQSELQITELMKNLSQSSIFTHPILTSISEKEGGSEAGRLFELELEEKGMTA